MAQNKTHALNMKTGAVFGTCLFHTECVAFMWMIYAEGVLYSVAEIFIFLS